jgi:hypothetical protein
MEMGMAGGITPWSDASYVSQSTQAQSGPSTAVTSANSNVITVWAEYDPALGRTVIKAKVLAFDGTVVADTYTLSSTATAGAGLFNPTVTALPNGNVVVAYQGGDSAIYTVTLNSSGNGVVPEQRANTTTVGSSQDAKIILLANNGYMVVWEANGNILSQAYNSSGVKVGAETFISTGAGLFDDRDPVVATLPFGSSIVAWTYTESRISGGEEILVHGFKFRLITNSGTQGTEHTVATGSAVVTHVSVSPL